MIYVLIGEDASRMEYKLERIKKEENCDQIDRFNCAKDDPAEIQNELVTMNLFATRAVPRCAAQAASSPPISLDRCPRLPRIRSCK